MRRSWAERAARVTAAVALALVAGCGGHGSPSPPRGGPAHHAGGDRPSGPEARIDALLARRARALPRREHLGLRRVRITVSGLHVRGRTATGTVVTAWGIRGVPGTFTAGRRTTFRRRGARGWRVARERGDRGLAPWDVADYTRRDLPHFVVLAPNGLDVDAAGLPATLADGYARFEATLPRAHLRRRYLVVVAASSAAARRLTLDIRGVGSLAAVADSAVRERGPAERVTRVRSQRLLVVWPAFSGLDAEGRGRVVAHELTHLALAGTTSGRTPSWLVEGIAMYVSGDRRSAEASALLRGAVGDAAAQQVLSLRRLSSAAAIAKLSGTPQAAAYAYASAAAFALADRFGRAGLLRVYERFEDPHLRGHAGPGLTSRALRSVTGEGLAAFERRLRAGLS